MGQLALINSSESEKLIVGYRQHLDNLGELNQCLYSFLDQPKVGQLVKLSDEGSSQNDLLGQLDGDLSGVSSNPQEDYNSLLAVWMDDFENADLYANKGITIGVLKYKNHCKRVQGKIGMLKSRYLANQ